MADESPTNGEALDETQFIFESEKDATPANDLGRIPKLEEVDGIGAKIARIFLPGTLVEEFTSTGAYIKKIGAKRVIVELWAGGASGAATNTNNKASGGGGGEYLKFELPASILASSEAVTIGAGGIAVSGGVAGNDGGDTTFGTTIIFGTANGGKAGVYGSIDALGGTGATDTLSNPKSEDGGIGDNSDDVGGSAVWAGAGGGGIDGTGGTPVSLGGASEFGGDGGDANATSTNGDDGIVPSGGGGGADGATSGAGGGGKIRITTIF